MSGDSSRRYPLELRERAVRMVAEISDQHIPRRFMLSCAKGRGVALITGAIGRVCGVDHGSDV